jgi:hypothetical protein
MEELDAFVLQLISDAGALPEDSMRLELLGRRLSPLPPEEIALFFDCLYKIDPHHKNASKVRHTLTNEERLREILGQGKYSGVLIAAMHLGLRKVSRLFSELPPHKHGASGYEHEEEARMEYVSLGMKRTLSKSRSKDTLDRLLSDPDPVVISNILNNPRTTERDVMKIASKRPNSPRILKLLAGHGKWSKRYDVIKSIALNPYSPPRLSIAILEILLAQDLKIIMESGSVHPQVRMSAKDIFWQKKG